MRRLLPLLLIACAAPERGDVKIIGHGGSGTEGEHPMNSRMALLGGLELGLDGVEIDVQMTADSVLVAYHSEDLGELTGCTGKINAFTWDALRSCPNTSAMEPSPIVRLDSVLSDAAVQFPRADFTLDCKLFAVKDWWSYLRAFADALGRLEQSPSLKGRLIVECQVTEFLDLVSTQHPVIDTYLYATDGNGAIDLALAHHYQGITVDNALITAEQVRAAQEQGLAVALFGVGTAPGHRDALGKEPDRLQTDSPSAFAH